MTPRTAYPEVTRMRMRADRGSVQRAKADEVIAKLMSYSAAIRDLGSPQPIIGQNGKTTEPKTPTNRCDDENEP